jgi:hypothetical protein
MKTIILTIQAVIFGFTAGIAFPEFVWQFWALLVANAVVTIAYGIMAAHEKDYHL